jgi:hypothetical protein
LCFTTCVVTSSQQPFSLSVARSLPTVALVGNSQSISTNCNNDYLIISGGYDPTNPNPNPPVTNMAFDRFCGERLNPQPSNGASVTVCSKFNCIKKVTRPLLVLIISFRLYSHDHAISNFLSNQRRRNDDAHVRCSWQRKQRILPQFPTIKKRK